ncbi:MAG TPA: UDP-N-acetylmuramoyl-L-alanyl-D-glutamate--2,6-diaminopimelate ligase [Candidatus Hydrogenedentes bacterium]|nr:UDP-N-acetylmuramoyl-L-alanyl-D-glutamate--2,6-diaminopimelate ligase [Candidatus Hydrogenedentota bacterium]HOL76011.1 UDP-N-acetylmuramoyl-L-alanyl-D-glutamate--2,6-diaminopimelate ligase [Candidatus Hydrogenedentota bacterium]HPO84625.1 UDP-N-acetylmuramoyl-L-alanyl-D-glutamate--2,6-diaminopimelate ligase [Candidatus Hydrogenedentota bacterium]
MRLRELQYLGRTTSLPRGEVDVVAATSDSRRVTPGTLFFACKGEHADGHDFAQQAATNGAVAIVGERKGLQELAGLPYIYVENVRRALGVTVHQLAGDPTQTMTVIGVTGTNGKTSSVILMQHVFHCAGFPAASFGTLGCRMGDVELPAMHTTPFAEELAERFRDARQAGITHVAMEVSSHALEQERVAGIRFRGAVFTNLTQDHLDYHKDMESYRRAKLMLFEQLEGNDAVAAINVDDPSAPYFLRATRVPTVTFGSQGMCSATNVSIRSEGTVFTAVTPWGTTEIEMRLVGRHNIANALGVIAVCGGIGIPLDMIAAGIHSVTNVPGRFERIDEGQPFSVIVDYAHTEDGLRNVLRTAREICSKRVICVFGCGGDRDKGKRPKMGYAVAELADFAVVTSDNPRSESPERILLDIEVGLQHAGKKKNKDYFMILDRAEAIHTALKMASEGDLVMIAGKGHENYQIIGSQRIHFDDREVARDFLKALQAKRG